MSADLATLEPESATVPPGIPPSGAELRPLSQATDPAQHGAKAASLARMMALGLRVPAGWVLPVACFEQHAQPPGRPLDGALQAALQAAMAGALRQGAQLAVRSSAVGEDSAQHSWAGQLDTVLGVSDAAALQLALRSVWASAGSPRSLAYQRQRGLPPAQMAVIVQLQVKARHAGVLFTHAPAGTGLAGTMVVEYCAGLGDALVSGEIDPARVQVCRATGRVVSHTLPDDGLPAALRDSELEALAAQARRLEGAFSCPLDIEWAIDHDGLLWLLQARPITTPVCADAAPAGPAALWTNANIAENFPDPVSPLLYSVVQPGYAAYFRNLGLGFGMSARRVQAMEPVLNSLVGVHGGRLYYNLSHIHALLRMAPAGAWLARAFNTFVGAAEFPPSRHVPPAQPLLLRALEGLRMAFKTSWQYLRIQARVARFEQRVERFCAGTRLPTLHTLPGPALLDALRGFLDIRLRRWNDAALADTAAMVCYALLQRTLRRAWPEAGESVHNQLLVGLPGLASHTPVEKLWDLSRRVRGQPAWHTLFTTHEPAALQRRLETDGALADLREDFDTYLERWGFRGTSELMLTAPSPHEDPRQALALLKAYVALDTESPEGLLARQVAARQAATDAACRQLSGPLWRALPLSRAGRFRLLLAATQGAIRLRERARMQQARLYVHLRHIALACGRHLVSSGRLAAADDVFMLSIDELQALLGGQAMFPYSVDALVAQRRAAHAVLSRLVPPDSFSLPEGSYLPLRPSACVPVADTEANEQLLRGTGACGGRITASAQVLADATEVNRLREGDIVVTRQTDPGWAGVFFLASGLVVERGGMLSHGAIIAREFGIPAVVGVRGATTRIRSGERLCVDGDRGLVERLHAL